jgi:hypothetical protein
LDILSVSGVSCDFHYILYCRLASAPDPIVALTVAHLPKTKASPRGEDVYWAKQNGATDPNLALENHLRVNNPPHECHLFAYIHKRGSRVVYRPLTKTKFLERVAKAARAANLEPLQGHGIRIGSTLEYLLWGVPFNVMRNQGRWAGDYTYASMQLLWPPTSKLSQL